MQRKEKSLGQLQIDKAVARTYYSRAFWTALAPALMMLSLMCGSIGRNGGDPIAWFTPHWIINSFWLACVAGLLCFAIVEILQGLRRASRFMAPEYSTQVVEKTRPDGTWTAELSKDGVPYARMEVNSISALLKRWR